jgi:hypothetical protein
LEVVVWKVVVVWTSRRVVNVVWDGGRLLVVKVIGVEGVGAGIRILLAKPFVCW